MSSTNETTQIDSLFIGYAHSSCSPQQVKDAFENALNEAGIVKGVDELIKKNQYGQDFKVFFIHFNRSNRQLQHMVDEIARHDFHVITYARDWDRRNSRYVNRFWKVFAYKPKPKPQESAPSTAEFVPRMMTRDEIQTLGIIAPKSVRESQAAATSNLEEGEIRDERAAPERPKKAKPDWPKHPSQETPDDMANTFKRLRFEDNDKKV